MLEIVKNIAVKAGDFLLQNFGRVNSIVAKGDRNLATDLDRKAEEMVVSVLSREFPSIGILGEEQAKINTNNEYLWIIDPLDGTHNFIRNIDIFGVSIGLWHKDKFILGVVYMPKDKELYYAEKGKGAYKNGAIIEASNISELKQASGCFDSSIRYSPEIMLEVLGRISKDVFNIRMFGSSVRTLTYLAEGKIDFTVEFHDRPWDFAGSVCIVEEAGGIFKSLKGQPASPKTIGYIAANKNIYPLLEKNINTILAR